MSDNRGTSNNLDPSQNIDAFINLDPSNNVDPSNHGDLSNNGGPSNDGGPTSNDGPTSNGDRPAYRDRFNPFDPNHPFFDHRAPARSPPTLGVTHDRLAALNDSPPRFGREYSVLDLLEPPQLRDNSGQRRSLFGANNGQQIDPTGAQAATGNLAAHTHDHNQVPAAAVGITGQGAIDQSQLSQDVLDLIDQFRTMGDQIVANRRSANDYVERLANMKVVTEDGSYDYHRDQIYCLSGLWYDLGFAPADVENLQIVETWADMLNLEVHEVVQTLLQAAQQRRALHDARETLWRDQIVPLLRASGIHQNVSRYRSDQQNDPAHVAWVEMDAVSEDFSIKEENEWGFRHEIQQFERSPDDWLDHLDRIRNSTFSDLRTWGQNSLPALSQDAAALYKRHLVDVGDRLWDINWARLFEDLGALDDQAAGDESALNTLQQDGIELRLLMAIVTRHVYATRAYLAVCKDNNILFQPRAEYSRAYYSDAEVEQITKIEHYRVRLLKAVCEHQAPFQPEGDAHANAFKAGDSFTHLAATLPASRPHRALLATELRFVGWEEALLLDLHAFTGPIHDGHFDETDVRRRHDLAHGNWAHLRTQKVAHQRARRALWARILAGLPPDLAALPELQVYRLVNPHNPDQDNLGWRTFRARLAQIVEGADNGGGSPRSVYRDLAIGPLLREFELRQLTELRLAQLMQLFARYASAVGPAAIQQRRVALTGTYYGRGLQQKAEQAQALRNAAQRLAWAPAVRALPVDGHVGAVVPIRDAHAARDSARLRDVVLPQLQRHSPQLTGALATGVARLLWALEEWADCEELLQKLAGRFDPEVFGMRPDARDAGVPDLRMPGVAGGRVTTQRAFERVRKMLGLETVTDNDVRYARAHDIAQEIFGLHQERENLEQPTALGDFGVRTLFSAEVFGEFSGYQGPRSPMDFDSP